LAHQDVVADRVSQMRIPLFMAAVAILALSFAGCGEGDSSGEDSTTTTTVVEEAPAESTTPVPDEPDDPTVEEFRAEADAICKRVNKQIQDLTIDEAEPILREGLDEIKKVEAPQELEVQWQQYLQAVQQQVDFQLSGEAKESARARDRKSQIALDLGLVQCGTG
jgi:ribosomal protein L11 methylase PrmA